MPDEQPAQRIRRKPMSVLCVTPHRAGTEVRRSYLRADEQQQDVLVPDEDGALSVRPPAEPGSR